MAFTLYRLSFSDPLQFYEQMGDPITSTGGAPVPALRAALRHSVSLANLTPNPNEETVENRLRLRRQWRSLVNNTPFKLQGFYLGWDADPENSGWYMPDQGQLVDLDGSVGLATGIFKVENFVWILAGRPRTHRRAVWAYLKDLRTGLQPRDYRRVIYSTDFAGLEALALTYLPPGVADLITTGSQNAVTIAQLPEGEDHGSAYVTNGLLDLARVSYEQPESQRNLGQVVAFDRRGEQTGPTAGPGANWEEVYGPDYPYSWMPPNAAAIDAPVLDNGRCRVRYDAEHTPGFIVESWVAGKWEEQGKLTFVRLSGFELLNQMMSATLVEYTETRAVLQAVMRNTTDAYSREEVFITLQQGWAGPRVELYTARNAAGEKVNASICFTLAAADADASIIKIDTGSTGRIEATAKGTGHTGFFATADLGDLTFDGENWVCIGRWGKAQAVNIAVLQKAAVAVTSVQTAAYGVNRNTYESQGLLGEFAGYATMQLGFSPQAAQQGLEAEAMTLGTGTAETADAEGSNGKTTTATRTTDANPHITQVKWPNSAEGTYRVFVKAKTSVATSKLKLYAKTTASTGATKETAATALGWVDLGDITATGGTLEIHAWLSAAGTLSVDRVEAFLVQDRFTNRYQGARDLGQATLYDSRAIPTIVSRSV